MGKGSQTTTSTSSPNPQALQAYSNLLTQAGQVASTPYTPYTSELVAPFNSQQNTGVAGINNYANYAQPYIQQAAGMATSAAAPITAANISQYESPYTQQVVDATQNQFNSQNAIQQQGVISNAAEQGALGGNRVGVTQANLANQEQLAQAPVIAGLENQGYQTGLNTALTEQQAQAAGAYSLGNLGVSGQNAGLTGASAQLGAGTSEQQTQQAQDTAAYQQFLNQLAYPFQTTQYLAGIDTGVGSQMGGTGTTTGPAPSMLGQILGGVSSGVGALGGTGAFGSAGWLAAAGLAGGGAVGRARGGVAPEDSGTVPESHETLVAQQHQLIDGHRRVQMFPHGTPELRLPHGVSRVVVGGDVFHYDPNRISAEQIKHLAANGRENELLDLGPVSKHEVMARIHRGEIPAAVVERRPDGTEVRAAAGTHITVPHQMAAMHRTKSPGNNLHIEDPRYTLAMRHRRSMGGGVAGYDGGGGVNYSQFGGGFGATTTPYSGGKGWVPGMGISHGQGVGGAPPLNRGMLQQPSSAAQMGQQIGAMAKAINGGGWNNPTNINSSAQGSFAPSPVGTISPIGISPEMFSPTEASGSSGSIYHRGGSVGRYSGGVANLPMNNRIMMPHGYADGGVAPGPFHKWSDTINDAGADFANNLARGMNTVSRATGLPYNQGAVGVQTDADMNAAQDISDAVPRPWRRGYADGGSPDNNGIPFDPTAGGIAPSFDQFGDAPTQFNVDPSVGDLAKSIYLNSGAPLPDQVSAKGDLGATPPSAFDHGAGPSFADRAAGEFDQNSFAPTGGVAPTLADQGVVGADVPLGPLTSPGFGGAPSAPVTGMEAIPPARAADISTPTAGYADNMDRIAAAHRQIESGGDYGNRGPINPNTGDRAYGAYQVMGANVPAWTKQYLGQSMTPEEFLHNPAAQDAVYKARMGQYINQYGLPGALDHWLGMGKADFTGTTHPEYQRRFMAALNGGASGPNGVANDAAAIPPNATLAQSTPENRGVAPPANGIDWSGNSKLWPALMAAGAGMLSSRSPFFGNALGEGLQSGMSQYAQEKAQEMKQYQVELEAKRLSQQADIQQKELALKTLPYQGAMTAAQKAENDYRQGLLARNRYRYEPGMGTDPSTGQMVSGMYRLPVLTDDPDAERTFLPNQTLTGRTQRTMTPIEIDREARQVAALEVGARPKPDDLQYIGKPALYDQALKKYQVDLETSINQHQQDIRKRYGITNPGGATPGTQQGNSAAPIPSPNTAATSTGTPAPITPQHAVPSATTPAAGVISIPVGMSMAEAIKAYPGKTIQLPDGRIKVLPNS